MVTRTNVIKMRILISAGMLDRQRLLEDQWYFKCGCSRCTDPSDCGSWSNSISCTQCANPSLTPSLPEADSKGDEGEEPKWSCTNCHCQLEASQAQDIIQRCKDKWNHQMRFVIQWPQKFLRTA